MNPKLAISFFVRGMILGMLGMLAVLTLISSLDWSLSAAPAEPARLNNGAVVTISVPETTDWEVDEPVQVSRGLALEAVVLFPEDS